MFAGRRLPGLDAQRGIGSIPAFNAAEREHAGHPMGSSAMTARTAGSAHTSVAMPAHGNVDVPAPVTIRKRELQLPQVGEADDLAAFGALKMRMRGPPMRRVPGDRESPHAIVAGMLVSQSLRGQPVEYAINRHAIDGLAIPKPPLQFVMRQRLVGKQQFGQNPDAVARYASASFRQHFPSADGRRFQRRCRSAFQRFLGIDPDAIRIRVAG